MSPGLVVGTQESPGLADGIVSLLEGLVDLVKTAFQTHWLLGLLVGLIVLSVVLYAFLFALLAVLVIAAAYFFWHGNYVAGGVLSAVTVAILALGYFSNRSEEVKKEKDQKEEKEDQKRRKSSALSSLVISIAKENNGRVSLAQVASHEDITVDQASSLLDSMVVKGVCRSMISDAGVVIYHFPEFEKVSSSDNQGATGLPG